MNKWYQRYYCQKVQEDTPVLPDFSFSNMMYDACKGVACAFVPLGDNSTRFITDSEIAYSSDPSITSRFSSQHREVVAKSLASQPKTPSVTGKRPDDDTLIANGGIRYLERDESVKVIRANSEAFDSSARQILRDRSRRSKPKVVPDHADSPAPAPAPAPSTSPASSNPSNS